MTEHHHSKHERNAANKYDEHHDSKSLVKPLLEGAKVLNELKEFHIKIKAKNYPESDELKNIHDKLTKHLLKLAKHIYEN